MNQANKHSQPVRADPRAWGAYAHDLADGLYPVLEKEIGLIRVLRGNSWRSVWREDPVAPAVVARAVEVRSDPRGAEERFRRALEAGKQVLSLPRTFLLRMEQLRPELFPVQRFVDLEVRYADPPADPDRPASPSGEALALRDFRRVETWLERLPIRPGHEVFLARRPDCTLTLPWGLFVHHWDCFYTWNWCTLNVADKDPGWFLFFHAEQLGIWGCTEEYAVRNAVPIDRLLTAGFDYSPEFRLLRERTAAEANEPRM